MTTAVLDHPRRPAQPGADAALIRLLVSRQDPQTRQYERVGVLSRTAEGYRFDYLRGAVDVAGFRPLLGFPDPHRSYRSAPLFPLFSERVMDPRRPDRRQWLDSLGFDGDPDVFEVLARTGGRRSGDTLELVALPLTADPVTLTFLVHGVRHVLGGGDAGVTAGDALELVAAPANPYNARALLVIAGADQRLGYVPDVLLDLVSELRGNGECSAHLLRANPKDVDPHMRFLVRLAGKLGEGSAWLRSSEWALATDAG